MKQYNYQIKPSILHYFESVKHIKPFSTQWSFKAKLHVPIRPEEYFRILISLKVQHKSSRKSILNINIVHYSMGNTHHILSLQDSSKVNKNMQDTHTKHVDPKNSQRFAGPEVTQCPLLQGLSEFLPFP